MGFMEELQAELDEMRRSREKRKIDCGEGIYRLPAGDFCWSSASGMTWWIIEVWERERFTTLLFAEENPPAEVVRNVFRHWKGGQV